MAQQKAEGDAERAAAEKEERDRNELERQEREEEEAKRERAKKRRRELREERRQAAAGNGKGVGPRSAPRPPGKGLPSTGGKKLPGRAPTGGLTLPKPIAAKRLPGTKAKAEKEREGKCKATVQKTGRKCEFKAITAGGFCGTHKGLDPNPFGA